MAGLSRVGRRLCSFAGRNALPQIAVSSAATVIGSLVIATVRPGGQNPTPPQPVVEQARPAAVPLAQLWPRQDPARLFSLSLELAPGATTATAPAFAEAAAGPKPRTAAPARLDAPKARRVLVTAADVLPPPRPASLAITAESASSEPTESPRLFGLKLPGSLAHVGGSVATTVASLGERIWDQLP
jgi:hypothetical protein